MDIADDSLRSVRARWMDALAMHVQSKESRYDTYVWEPISPAVFELITRQVALGPKPSKRQVRNQHGGADPAVEQLQMAHPGIQTVPAREQLRRLLVVVAKWRSSMAAALSFGLFCAFVLSVLGTERLAFRAIVRLSSRYCLEDYRDHRKGDPRLAMTDDILKVWKWLAETCPVITQTFTRLKQEDLFAELVEPWLASVFTEGMNRSCQPYQASLVIIDWLIMNSGNVKLSPYRNHLCHVAYCILARHKGRFAEVKSKADLYSLVDNISQITVDRETKAMMDDKGLHQVTTKAARIPAASSATRRTVPSGFTPAPRTNTSKWECGERCPVKAVEAVIDAVRGVAAPLVLFGTAFGAVTTELADIFQGREFEEDTAVRAGRSRRYHNLGIEEQETANDQLPWWSLLIN